MDSTNFAYWLQGALELFPDAMSKGLSGQQVQIIQDHLDLVLNKVTPNRSQERVEPLPMPSDELFAYCSGADNVEQIELPSLATDVPAGDHFDAGYDSVGFVVQRASGASASGIFSTPQAPEWGNWGDDLPAVGGGRYC